MEFLKENYPMDSTWISTWIKPFLKADIPMESVETGTFS